MKTNKFSLTLTLVYLFLIGIFSLTALYEISYAQTGKIQVKKITVPGGFGDFEFEINQGEDPPVETFILDDNELDSHTLAPDDYKITEDIMAAAQAGFDLTDISCLCSTSTDCDDVDLEDGLVEVTLKESETITCSFTNTGNGTIIIEKQTVPEGGENFDFATDIPGSGNDSFTLDDKESEIIVNVPAGQYEVTEFDPSIDPGGYTLSDIVCDDIGSSTDVPTRTATIDMDPNEIITCTFTNTTILEGLTISKFDTPDPVVAGKNLTYELVIENNSEFVANQVFVTDFLPDGVILQSISVDPLGIFCVEDLFGDVDCNLGTVLPDEIVTITIVVIPDPDVFDEIPTQIENTAILEAEPGSVFRETSTITLVNPIVMIDVENNKGDRTSVEQGKNFELKYNITNNANEIPEQFLVTLNQQSLTPEQRADALGVIFNLNFSVLFEVISVQTTKEIACIVAPGSIECPLGNIDEGQTETVTINFRAPQDKDTYDFDAIVTSLLQIFENKFRVRVESDSSNCSIAAAGSTMTIPFYLFIPLFVLVRRFWRKVVNKKEQNE